LNRARVNNARCYSKNDSRSLLGSSLRRFASDHS